MSRHFNVAGPCHADRHYMIESERLAQARVWIDQGAYFVIHGPRQSGKTTAVRRLVESLNETGRFAAVMTTCETGSSREPDLEGSIVAVVEALLWNAGWQLPVELRPPRANNESSPRSRLLELLSHWAATCPRPLFIAFDEIDALFGEALNSVLRQLRSGYDARPKNFPHALALVGLRDVRDYRLAAGGGATLGTSSPFNIKIDSLTLPNFTLAEVTELYHQHQLETGQEFQPEAVACAFDLTGGQPWLVNALARVCVEDLVPDRARVISAEHVAQAKEILIVKRQTHLDSLIERLREPRIRPIVSAILAGELLDPEILNDDIEFALDLGLIKHAASGLEIANPIYREIVPRALTDLLPVNLPKASVFIDPNGRLELEKLLDAFAAFWRENAEDLLGRTSYPEAAPQLVAMAFLHRVVNGGGTIDREFAVGRKRVDLCIRWPVGKEVQRLAFELKVWRDRAVDPLASGLEQISNYLERLDLAVGTLVIFDCRSDARPLAERIELSRIESLGRQIHLLRL